MLWKHNFYLSLCLSVCRVFTVKIQIWRKKKQFFDNVVRNVLKCGENMVVGGDVLEGSEVMNGLKIQKWSQSTDVK